MRRTEEKLWLASFSSFFANLTLAPYDSRMLKLEYGELPDTLLRVYFEPAS